MSREAVQKSLTAYGVTDPLSADVGTLMNVIDLAVTIDIAGGVWTDVPVSASEDEQHAVYAARREEERAQLQVIQTEAQLAEARETRSNAETDRLTPMLDAWRKNQGVGSRPGGGNTKVRVVHDGDDIELSNPVTSPASVEDFLATWRATYGN